MKTITIPRLELTAALVSVKIRNLLISEMKHKVTKEVFWTLKDYSGLHKKCRGFMCFCKECNKSKKALKQINGDMYPQAETQQTLLQEDYLHLN